MPASASEIEVKFAVAEGDTARAMKRLGLSKIVPDKEYTVHFFDREPAMLVESGLLKKGLILRVRQIASGGDWEDSTCEVRSAEADEMFARFFGGRGRGQPECGRR